MPSREQVYQLLVLRGLLPTDAWRIVQDVEDREFSVLSPGEAEMSALLAGETPDLDRLLVLVTPDIPDEFRRLWAAGKR